MQITIYQCFYHNLLFFSHKFEALKLVFFFWSEPEFFKCHFTFQHYPDYPQGRQAKKRIDSVFEKGVRPEDIDHYGFSKRDVSLSL